MVCFTFIVKAKGHAEKLWKVYDAIPVAVHLIDHVLVLLTFVKLFEFTIAVGTSTAI